MFDSVLHKQVQLVNEENPELRVTQEEKANPDPRDCRDLLVSLEFGAFRDQRGPLDIPVKDIVLNLWIYLPSNSLFTNFSECSRLKIEEEENDFK